jgi:hypothetical protein
VAISSQSGKLLETACFDQTLNQVWFDKLSLTNQQSAAKLAQIPSILTVGLLAPVLMSFRDGENAVNVCQIIVFFVCQRYFRFRIFTMNRKSLI